MDSRSPSSRASYSCPIAPPSVGTRSRLSRLQVRGGQDARACPSRAGLSDQATARGVAGAARACCRGRRGNGDATGLIFRVDASPSASSCSSCPRSSSASTTCANTKDANIMAARQGRRLPYLSLESARERESRDGRRVIGSTKWLIRRFFADHGDAACRGSRNRGRASAATLAALESADRMNDMMNDAFHVYAHVDHQAFRFVATVPWRIVVRCVVIKGKHASRRVHLCPLLLRSAPSL